MSAGTGGEERTVTVDSTSYSASAQAQLSEIRAHFVDEDNPRRGETRFLQFETENQKNAENASSERLKFFKAESFGCCRKIMRVLLYDIIIATMLLAIGVCGMVTTQQIRSEISLYFNNWACDDYIITNTTEHADAVFYISMMMAIWSLLIVVALFVFWKWTWSQLIDASHEPGKYLIYRASIKQYSRYIFWANLGIFFVLNMLLFFYGTRFWRDVEDADNEPCIRDSTLDDLSNQLKFTLMPSFITACAGGSSIILAYFAFLWCPFGLECCGVLCGVKDEAKFRGWQRQNQAKHANGSGGSCS